MIIANNGVFMTASFSPSKWFETCRNLSGSYCVILWVRVVLKRTVGDYLGKGLTQTAINSHYTSIVYLDRFHSSVGEDSPSTKVPGRSRGRV